MAHVENVTSLDLACFHCGGTDHIAAISVRFPLETGESIILCEVCLALALTAASGIRFDRNLAVIRAGRQASTEIQEENRVRHRQRNTDKQRERRARRRAERAEGPDTAH